MACGLLQLPHYRDAPLHVEVTNARSQIQCAFSVDAGGREKRGSRHRAAECPRRRACIGCGHHPRSASHRADAAFDPLAVDVELPKEPRHDYGGGDFFADRVSKLTDGKFNIPVFAAVIACRPSRARRCAAGTVEMCHTATYDYVGKDSTMGFGTVLPFGLTTRQQKPGRSRRWCRHDERLLQGLNVIGYRAGNTGAQTATVPRPGETIADFKGLKMRIPGLGGQVMARIGAVPQALPGGDIYPRSSAARSTRPNGSAPTTTRSSASTRSPSTITIRVGGNRARCIT